MTSIDTRLSQFAAAAVMGALVGCATPQAARDMATETLAAVADYEQQVNEKVITEKSFYRNEADEIRKFILGEVDSERRPVERSLVYGQIVNSTHRDARLAAEAMLYAPKVDVMGRTIAFVDDGIEEDLALFRELSERRVALRTRLFKELATIDQQKARLAKVKKGLSTLSKDSDPLTRFKLFKEHAKVIKDALEVMRSQSDARPDVSD